MNIISKIKSLGTSIIIIFLSIISPSGNSTAEKNDLPKDFVIVTDIVPEVILEMRYYSSYNFVGGKDRFI